MWRMLVTALLFLAVCIGVILLFGPADSLEISPPTCKTSYTQAFASSRMVSMIILVEPQIILKMPESYDDWRELKAETNQKHCGDPDFIILTVILRAPGWHYGTILASSQCDCSAAALAGCWKTKSL